MFQRQTAWQSGRSVPQTYHSIGTCRDECFVIGGEGERRHRPAMVHDLSASKPRSRVPEPGGLVFTRGRQDLAVMGVPDRLDRPAMLERRTKWFGGDRIPQPCGAILAAGGDRLAGRVPGHDRTGDDAEDKRVGGLANCSTPRCWSEWRARTDRAG